MRLLFDQNLSRHLADRLTAEYPDSAHVAEVGLDVATDRVIWDYAGVEGYAIALFADSDEECDPGVRARPHRQPRTGRTPQDHESQPRAVLKVGESMSSNQVPSRRSANPPSTRARCLIDSLHRTRGAAEYAPLAC